MIKILIGALALTASALAPAAAETRSVRFDDLNLSSQAGMERLEWRIHSAARLVCGGTASGPVSLADRAAIRECIAEAKAKAARQVAALDIVPTRGG